MKLSELRNGMLVKTRNGNEYVVIKESLVNGKYQDVLINIDTGAYMALIGYDDGMLDKTNENYDIFEVWQCKFIGDVIKGIAMSKNIKGLYGVTKLFHRDTEKDALQALIAKLSSDLTEANAKLEALR